MPSSILAFWTLLSSRHWGMTWECCVWLCLWHSTFEQFSFLSRFFMPNWVLEPYQKKTIACFSATVYLRYLVIFFYLINTHRSSYERYLNNTKSKTFEFFFRSKRRLLLGNYELQIFWDPCSLVPLVHRNLNHRCLIWFSLHHDHFSFLFGQKASITFDLY